MKLIALIILFVSTLTAMGLDKMKVTAQCKDVRIAMDGGISAVVQSGGIKKHTEVLVYQLHPNIQRHKKELIFKTQVSVKSQMVDGSPVEIMKSPNLELVIFKNKNGKNNLASIKATNKNSNIFAQLTCVL